MEKAKSEGNVSASRPARIVKPPARLRDASEVVSVLGSQTGASDVARSSKVAETSRQGARNSAGLVGPSPMILGDNWHQPTGRVEPVFFEELDRWSAILEDEGASYVRLRDAQSQLEAIRDRETFTQQVLTGQFNDRRNLLSAMIEGVKDKLASSKMVLEEGVDDDGQVVEVLKRKRGGAKQ